MIWYVHIVGIRELSSPRLVQSATWLVCELTFGTRFDLKRFHAEAEKLKFGSNISGARSCANFNNNEVQQNAQSRMSDSRRALHDSMSTLKQHLKFNILTFKI